MELSDLVEIEAIKRLKYRYMRCVDRRLFDELATCFAPDATSSYGDGKYSFDGRDAIIDFLSNALGPETLTLHTVHHPEIELTSPTTATATWVLDDWVLNTSNGSKLHGGAYYSDTYVKIDGEWVIQSTGYERIFEDHSGFARTL